MKLNNKGFAISTIMYMILIMAVILITLTLTLLSSRKLILDKTKQVSKDNIYEVYDLSYREVLEILKSEAIDYATNQNLEKDSIKIENLNSSVEKEILDGYKLSEKYLTMVSNNNSYDVYLGKSRIVITNETIKNLIDVIDYNIIGNSIQDTTNGDPSPNNPIDIKSLGDLVTDSNDANYGKYKIPIRISGKNLFNKNGAYKMGLANFTPLETGIRATLTASSQYAFSGIEIGRDELLGKTITIKATMTPSANNKGQVILYYGTSTSLTKQVVTGSMISGVGTKTATFTIENSFPEGCDRIWVLIYGNSTGTSKVGDYVDYTNFMIEENTTSTEYEDYNRQDTFIYLDEPLRKNGSYIDSIEFKNQNITRQNKRINIDGTEVWEKNNNREDYDIITVRLFTVDDNKLDKIILSDQYKYLDALWNHTASSYSWKISQYSRSFYISVDNATVGITSEDTSEERTQKLSNYIKDHNFYAIYPLETQSSNTINLPKISTGLDHNSNISIDTEIQPSSYEFTVIQKIKQI